jgi:hypothetical protein
MSPAASGTSLAGATRPSRIASCSTVRNDLGSLSRTMLGISGRPASFQRRSPMGSSRQNASNGIPCSPRNSSAVEQAAQDEAMKSVRG